MTDTPPLSLADRARWQQEASIYVESWTYPPDDNPRYKLSRRILVLLAALERQEAAEADRQRLIEQNHTLQREIDSLKAAVTLWADAAKATQAKLDAALAVRRETEEKPMPEPAPYRTRTIEQLRGALQTACDVIWNRGTHKVNQHVWTIPVDQERDFDCILGDGIAELATLRQSLAALTQQHQKLISQFNARDIDAACAQAYERQAHERIAWYVEEMRTARAQRDTLKAELAALTREKETLMAALATARDEQAGFTVTDDIKRICDGYRQMTLNMSESRDELKHENRHLKDKLAALTAAYESLKGEHERLRAHSNSNATAAVLLFEDRAAIERQAISETLEKVLAAIEAERIEPTRSDQDWQINKGLTRAYGAVAAIKSSLRPSAPANY